MNIMTLMLGIYCVVGIFLCRNNCVWCARTQFLFKTRHEAALYDALPSYDEMLYHPKHWHRWTKAQWADYANRVTKK